MTEIPLNLSRVRHGTGSLPKGEGAGFPLSRNNISLGFLAMTAKTVALISFLKNLADSLPCQGAVLK
jgi:hypothetical protein